ncbi:MAG: hypothetical protein K2X81_25225 [Candidatus Obscuribacterales bacterium]|nr:hypothetical protein [Candidatus Obscuribacterales bacterium]
MSESNNVKFVEADGKWAWKRYDAEGSVIFRSPLFNTEREAREDYEINGGPVPSNETSAGEAVPSNESGQSQDVTPEGAAESTVGTATGEETQSAENDNSAGSASL